MRLLSRLPGTGGDPLKASLLFPCGGPDDDGIIDADDAASMDGDSASGFSRSRGECFRTPSASRRVTQCPLFPPVQHLFTAADCRPNGQSAAAVNNIALLSSAMVSLSADREAYGPEEAARWLAVSRFSSAILQLCQPIAVSAGRHMAWATMILRVIWLSHTAVAERERASLVQGPLAPDGLFGPRFSEVLAHQQSVRENRSRFGAILTRSSHQQAGRRRGPGRFQDSSPGAAAAAAADWVAVGRRVHMASGSPASKKRRPLEPLVARARGYGRLYRSPSSPHYRLGDGSARCGYSLRTAHAHRCGGRTARSLFSGHERDV
ncbi:unnamed protein product [Boreogadus saida]